MKGKLDKWHFAALRSAIGREKKLMLRVKTMNLIAAEVMGRQQLN